ncbi:MAG: helix-turn-helix transcriptional regulator [Rhizobiaceae bacterium]|nr:helix-turn-helix transcriptional regulator [Rhizobiaceae bacterium]
MPKKMLQPTDELMFRVGRAFLDFGYGELSMTGLARACGFTQRALYYYFSNKEEAFRASIEHRNRQAVNVAFAAAAGVREKGGSVLDIVSTIMDVRYGETRRALNVSPHTVELNAEAFRRCRDIMIESALAFQADLEEMIVGFCDAGLLRMRDDISTKDLAQALADGARGVNQALPTIPSEGLTQRYRGMCQLVLYGAATPPGEKPARKSRKDPA